MCLPICSNAGSTYTLFLCTKCGLVHRIDAQHEDDIGMCPDQHSFHNLCDCSKARITLQDCFFPQNCKPGIPREHSWVAATRRHLHVQFVRNWLNEEANEYALATDGPRRVDALLDLAGVIALALTLENEDVVAEGFVEYKESQRRRDRQPGWWYFVLGVLCNQAIAADIRQTISILAAKAEKAGW